MVKVTYLFGAGASAQYLPVVKEIPSRLDNFLEFIAANTSGSEKKYDRDFGITYTVAMAEADFIAEIKDLVIQVRKHQSIDTYAKKLRLLLPHKRGLDLKYQKLKVILSCFFIYEQLINPTDDRYDAFFASILQNSNRDFITNLRIVSWNYDFQFEKAYNEYSHTNSLANNQHLLSVYPSTLRFSDYENKFGIFKLNGTTGFYNGSMNVYSNTNIYDKFDIDDPNSLVNDFMWLYVGSINNKVRPLLSFAWEKGWEKETQELIETTKMAVEGTEVLVIIGYSIPFFNREVDREIMKVISEHTKKVYIQDCYPDRVLEKLPSIWNGDLPRYELKDQVDQFFLPPEL